MFGLKSKLHGVDFVTVDTATTGISVIRDRIVELGAVRVRDGKIQEEFTTLVNPGVPIPAASSKLHHITDRMVRRAPSIEEVLPGFFSFWGDDLVVGYNLSFFDLPMLQRAAKNAHLALPGNQTADLRDLPGMPDSLAEACALAKHKQSAPYRALDDARSAAAVYLHFANQSLIRRSK